MKQRSKAKGVNWKTAKISTWKLESQSVPLDVFLKRKDK